MSCWSRAQETASEVRLEGFEAHRWLAPGALTELPHGAATRRALALALDPPDSG